MLRGLPRHPFPYRGWTPRRRESASLRKTRRMKYQVKLLTALPRRVRFVDPVPERGRADV